MTRPGLKLPPKVQPKSTEVKPKGLPAVKPEPRSTEPPQVTAAKKAVAKFENERRVLVEMREDWDKNFPEANEARKEILTQEDTVNEAIKFAKPLVAAAKQDIGEFTVQRKYSSAGYDSALLLDVLKSSPKAGELFVEMLKAGIVKVVALENEAALAWAAQRPNYAKILEPAFKEREEMTTAVTVPKNI